MIEVPGPPSKRKAQRSTSEATHRNETIPIPEGKELIGQDVPRLTHGSPLVLLVVVPFLHVVWPYVLVLVV